MLTISMSRRSLLTSAAMAATFGLDRKLTFRQPGTCGNTARADDGILQVQGRVHRGYGRI